MRASSVPLPVSSDAEDVAIALETAQALWKKLDYAEAVRWVRRAALAAEESGDDLRGVRLAASAADITTELSMSGSATPNPSSVAPPVRPSPLPPKPPVSSRPPSAPA